MGKYRGIWGHECWFCNRPVKPGKRANRHHVFPKRYGVQTTVHLACRECHRLYHEQVDDPTLSFEEWKERMATINFGRGIYAD